MINEQKTKVFILDKFNPHKWTKTGKHAVYISAQSRLVGILFVSKINVFYLVLQQLHIKNRIFRVRKYICKRYWKAFFLLYVGIKCYLCVLNHKQAHKYSYSQIYTKRWLMKDDFK